MLVSIQSGGSRASSASALITVRSKFLNMVRERGRPPFLPTNMNNAIPAYELPNQFCCSLTKKHFAKEISTPSPHRRLGGFALLCVFLITSLKLAQPLTTLSLKEGKRAVENRVRRTEKRKSLLTGTAPHVVSSYPAERFTQRCLRTSTPGFLLKAIT